MLNFKKTFTVIAKIESTLPVSLSLILLFCWLGNLYAQMPGDFPEGREFDPRHPFIPTSSGGRPLDLRESGISPSDISKDVELVGATGGVVSDVFVQDNYAYICAGGTLTILDVSAPSNPMKVGYVALPDVAEGVYVQDGLAYVADCYSGLLIIDVSDLSSPNLYQ